MIWFLDETVSSKPIPVAGVRPDCCNDDEEDELLNGWCVSICIHRLIETVCLERVGVAFRISFCGNILEPDRALHWRVSRH